MDYYKLRRKAIMDIDEMLRNKKSIELIKYIITQRYGFTEKIVNDRMNQIKAIKE